VIIKNFPRTAQKMMIDSFLGVTFVKFNT